VLSAALLLFVAKPWPAPIGNDNGVRILALQ
jgi:hypothetical protein